MGVWNYADNKGCFNHSPNQVVHTSTRVVYTNITPVFIQTLPVNSLDYPGWR